MKILKRQLNNEQTQKNYRRVAWFYNMWSALTESKAAEKVIELAQIKNGERIVEIACGTGLVFKEILKKNPNGFNLGIDLSIDMLSKAKKLIGDSKGQNFELRQGDVLNLQLQNQTFDKVINNFMIDLMPKEKFDKILSEFYQILKPNGIAVISVFTKGKRFGNSFWSWMAKHFPIILTNCRPVEIGANIINAGFEIEEEIEISQNTFPSKVYRLKRKNYES